MAAKRPNRIALELTPWMLEQLRAEKTRTGLGLSEIIRAAVAHYLEMRQMSTRHETFPTRAAAQARICEMMGWPKARATKILGYASKENFEAGKTTEQWVIEATPGQYLCDDGYVR